MVARFVDNVAGTPIYINPSYVVALRPDPVDPTHVSIVKLEDGESIRVQGDHEDVARKLRGRRRRAAAAKATVHSGAIRCHSVRTRRADHRRRACESPRPRTLYATRVLSRRQDRPPGSRFSGRALQVCANAVACLSGIL